MGRRRRRGARLHELRLRVLYGRQGSIQKDGRMTMGEPTKGPEAYRPLGRVGNAIYVIMIALAIFGFLLSVMGNLGRADMVVNLIVAALACVAFWGLGWVIRRVLGGGPAK